MEWLTRFVTFVLGLQVVLVASWDWKDDSWKRKDTAYPPGYAHPAPPPTSYKPDYYAPHIKGGSGYPPVGYGSKPVAPALPAPGYGDPHPGYGDAPKPHEPTYPTGYEYGYGPLVTSNNKEYGKKLQSEKLFSVTKGIYVEGGQRVYGRFKNLEECEHACFKVEDCFAGDYDVQSHNCYLHTNASSCNYIYLNSKSIHFKKIPCRTEEFGVANGIVVMGARIPGNEGDIQNSIHDMIWCLKECLHSKAAGFSLSKTSYAKGCQAINYDFYTRQCYHYRNVIKVPFGTGYSDFEFCDPYWKANHMDFLHPAPSFVTISMCKG